MFSRSDRFNSLRWLVIAAMVFSPCMAGRQAAAQDNPSPNWEVFGGYSLFYPGGTVYGLLPNGILPVSSAMETNPRGGGASLTYDFNRWFGLTADVSGQFGSGESGVGDRIDDVSMFNISGGPKITFRTRHFSPFLEALVGGHRLKSDLFNVDDRFGFMAGGGLDWNVKRHFALRLFRADYVFSNHQYGASSIVPDTEVRGLRAQAGLVFLFGDKKSPAPVSANCIANPGEVIGGEPVTVSMTANNFNPKDVVNYSWNSTGGKATGNDAVATVDTSGVAPGPYTVTGHVSDSRMKHKREATCIASFAVKEPRRHPPEISCSANPATVRVGDTTSIICSCASPDNAAVTVGNWAATGGSVSGSNGSAILDSTGAAPGSVTVTATCSDVRGLHVDGATEIAIAGRPAVSPEVSQLESRLALHSIYFATAHPTVMHPDGGLLQSQEQTLVALASDFQNYLQTSPDAHFILEGHADPRASAEYNQLLSQRRVERTKRFLIEHGVPAANIQTTAFGDQRNLTEADVRDLVARNPELTAEQRERVLNKIDVVLLASNRRVDITLSTTGQISVRQYPFNAADSLTLLAKENRHQTTSPKNEKSKPAKRH